MHGSDNFAGDNEEGERIGGIGVRIHPAPVLFTDTFRWLLYQENNRWDLPDAHYHWGAVANNSSRAIFLPEARVLTTESDASPSQYPKMKYADAKIEPAESNTEKAPASFNGFKAKTGLKTTGLPPKEFNGYKAKNDSKTTGLPPKESFFKFPSKEINDDETNSLTSEFQDEAPMQQVRQGNTISLFHSGCGCYQTVPMQYAHLQASPSTPGQPASRRTMPMQSSLLKAAPSTSDPEAASRRTNITSVNTVTSAPSEMEDDYDFETVISNDAMSMSEYEEQTVNTGYEEYTVMSEVIEEELDDVISSYGQTSGVRFD